MRRSNLAGAAGRDATANDQVSDFGQRARFVLIVHALVGDRPVDGRFARPCATRMMIVEPVDRLIRRIAPCRRTVNRRRCPIGPMDEAAIDLPPTFRGIGPPTRIVIDHLMDADRDCPCFVHALARSLRRSTRRRRESPPTRPAGQRRASRTAQRDHPANRMRPLPTRWHAPQKRRPIDEPALSGPIDALLGVIFRRAIRTDRRHAYGRHRLQVAREDRAARRACPLAMRAKQRGRIEPLDTTTVTNTP